MTTLNLSLIYAQDSFTNYEVEGKLANNFKQLNDKYVVTPTAINTDLSDVGTTFFMEKYIIYSSRKTGAIGAGKDVNTNNPYNALYCLNVDKTGNLSKPYFFASTLNQRGNEGGLAFNANQKMAYYTNSSEKNSKNYQLYKASFNPECKCSYAWKPLGKTEFNSDEYSIENPSVSPDGKKLFFSSNKPGGFGGYDIYSADIDENGNLKNLKNLGNKINTSGDENYPFLSPENQFYFSSNGLDGFGGFDIFVSKLTDKYLTTPLNLGKTINTKADEVAFILGSKDWGFLTSNRNEGNGLYDIYKFNFEKSVNRLKGMAIEKNSKIVLPNAKIQLIDQAGDVIDTKTTDDKGNYSFDITPLEPYTIVATKEGYEDFKMPVIADVGEKTTDVEMDLKPAVVTETSINVEKIYFEYNKSNIKKESTLALDKIYNVLKEYPDMKISINAHTDTRGSDVYNQTLSDKRALAAKNYLIKKGINKERINSKGFGKTQPLSNCQGKCTEAEYEADRRVEFIIVK